MIHRNRAAAHSTELEFRPVWVRLAARDCFLLLDTNFSEVFSNGNFKERTDCFSTISGWFLSRGTRGPHAGAAAHASSAAVAPLNEASSAPFFRRYEIYQAYRNQLNAAAKTLNMYIDSRIAQLYANGNPGPNALAGLMDEISGAVDATTFRVSSQVALLPGTQNRVIAQIQNSQLSGNPRALVSEIQRLVSNPRLNQQGRWLAGAIGQSISRNTQQNALRVGNYLRNAPIYALSVDPSTGQRIPVQQYMAQQVLEQFRNSMGSLSAAIQNSSNTTLFNNGVFNSDPAVQQAYAMQVNDAVSIIANQVGYNLALFPSNLHLFPNSNSNLITTLNDLFYGSQTPGNGAITTNALAVAPQATPAIAAVTPALLGTYPSLYNSLATVPTTSSGFGTGVYNAFNNTYGYAAGAGELLRVVALRLPATRSAPARTRVFTLRITIPTETGSTPDTAPATRASADTPLTGTTTSATVTTASWGTACRRSATPPRSSPASVWGWEPELVFSNSLSGSPEASL